MFTIEDFTRIESYEDCPVDVPLLVWTGDSFDVTYIDIEVEYGSYYPANGVDFVAYIALPDEQDFMDDFDNGQL